MAAQFTHVSQGEVGEAGNVQPSKPSQLSQSSQQSQESTTKLANSENQPRGKTTEDSNAGSFAPAEGGDNDNEGKSLLEATDKEVDDFLNSPLKDITVDMANSLLTKGFYVTDGSGNQVHFGKAMKKHLEDHTQSESDRRKRRLRFGVELVRTTTPVDSSRDVNVSCYFGPVCGKNYLVLADKKGEILEVFDLFRNDKWKNK